MDKNDAEFVPHGDDLVRYSRRNGNHHNPNLSKGCEGVCYPGFSFIFKSYNECNYCTVHTLRELFGHCEVVEDDDRGVLAVVRKTPYVWFADYPTHCTCKL